MPIVSSDLFLMYEKTYMNCIIQTAGASWKKLPQLRDFRIQRIELREITAGFRQFTLRRSLGRTQNIIICLKYYIRLNNPTLL